MSEVALQHVLRPAGDAVVLQPAETYRIAGIYSFGRGLFEREPIRGADTSYETLVRLREGELVVSKLNGWEGAVDVVPPEIAGCHVSGEYPVFSIDRERAEPAYLRWITRWPAFWERLIPRGSMVRRKRVQVAQLLQVSVPLPAIDEQRCVAARLDRARALSDRLFDRGARFERLAAALRASLLGGRHARRASTPIELGEVLRLDEHRVSVTSAATYPIVGVYSFGRGLFQRGDLEGSATSYKSLNRVGAGQVVIGSQGRSARAWRGWFPVPLSIPCVRFSRTRLADDLLGIAYAVPG